MPLIGARKAVRLPFSPEFRERHIDAPHSGSLVAFDTFLVGSLKGVGKVYLQRDRLPPALRHPVRQRTRALRPDQHPYELVLQLEEMGTAPPGSSARSPTAIVQRLHRALLDEHFHVEGRRTWFETNEKMQRVLDSCLEGYNHRRPDQGRGMNGRRRRRLRQRYQKVQGQGGEGNHQKTSPERHLSQRHRSGAVRRLPSLYR
jgi:hypothetical protein